MKKMLTLVLALMLALTVVGACAEKQVLTVVTWDATTTPYLVAQEAAFEAKYPDVDLQYIDVASQDYAIKVGTMLSGGDTSDVVMIKEARDIINWQAAGYAAPMSDYIAADKFDLAGYVGTEVNYAVDGVQYAELPLGADDEVVITQANGARNCVEIRDGQVRMREANCPTGSCVACGWLDPADEAVRLLPDARWIICLPNRVSVELVLGGTS